MVPSLNNNESCLPKVSSVLSIIGQESWLTDLVALVFSAEVAKYLVYRFANLALDNIC
jgi:hypothetical protein